MPAQTRGRPEAPNGARWSWLLPVVVVLVATVLVVLVVALDRGGSSAPESGSPTSSGAPTQVQEPEQPDLSSVETRKEGDLLAAGPVDAPVVLVVFSDYQCPFCARWSEQTLPSMMEHVDAGELRIEWRDVNVFGPASERASRASYAAGVQGGFWEFHDALFEGGEPRPGGDLDEDELVELAGELGLDEERFVADYASQETAEVIAANQQLGFDIGATSTPVFILGGQPIVGAQPTEVFEAAFQSALDAAQ